MRGPTLTGPDGNVDVLILGGDLAARVLALQLCLWGDLRIGLVEPPERSPMAPVFLPHLPQGLELWPLDSLFPQVPRRDEPAPSMCWGSAQPQERGPRVDDRVGLRVSDILLMSRLLDMARARGLRVWQGQPSGELLGRPGAWQVAVEGLPGRIGARLVVESGRGGLCRRLGATPRVLDAQCALGVTVDEPSGDRTMRVEADEQGWWWSAAQGNGRRFFALVSGPEQLEAMGAESPHRWAQLAARSSHAWSEVGAAPRPEQLERREMQIMAPTAVGGAGWLVMGEAAQRWEPFYPDLALHHFESGLSAARWVDQAIGPDPAAEERGLRLHQQSEQSQAQRAQLWRAHLYAREQRWPDSPYWGARHQHIFLEPDALLQHRPRERSGPLPRRLQSVDLNFLHYLIRHPRPAHEVVSAHRGWRATSDAEVVLALQWQLMAGEIVQVNAREADPASPRDLRA